MTDHGPYETEREAWEAVRHAYEPQGMSWGATGTRLLEEACTAANVTLGAYDRRIVRWIALYEPSTIAVLAGLITRAYEAGAATAGRTSTDGN